ncbi:hypothetical protein SR83_15540 [Klebsiella aerogenes]|nr:hypothetical protein SR83_15540 [Klebsiella aerogenes]KJO48493.1 hypothetical protein SR85_14240 [Klebsiella aerogenes]
MTMVLLSQIIEILLKIDMLHIVFSPENISIKVIASLGSMMFQHLVLAIIMLACKLQIYYVLL